MNNLNEEMDRIYARAFERLSRMLHAPDADLSVRARVHAALRTLHRAYANAGVASLADRAVVLNTLAQTIHGVLGMQLSLSPIDALMLEQAATDARALLLQTAREVFPDEAVSETFADDPDRPVEPAEEHTVPKPASDDTAVASSRVPADKRAEYAAMFAQCLVRPSRAETVNWYAKTVCEHHDRYSRVGDPLGIPWWFIGAIHALESGFRFSGHLHNGDPLEERTRRVPAGRPVEGEPPFSWEESARDAMKYKSLDRWNDWSIPGALFQWESYNGFGYRKFGVPSPYLWSFSNHYTQGKYVRDHVFDRNAVSNQCGAATLLRVLINQGAVRID